MIHLRIPMLAQDEANHDEKMVEFSITEINHAKLKDSRPQSTNTEVSLHLLNITATLNTGGNVENAVRMRPSLIVQQSATLPRAASQTL